MKIDLIVEKYLTSIKKWGQMIDIYTNPTKSEMKEIGSNIRFIADPSTKTIYMWSAMTAVHADVWLTVGDGRSLYKSGEVLPGEIDGKFIVLDSFYSMIQSARKQLKEKDWSWVKQIDLQGQMDGVK